MTKHKDKYGVYWLGVTPTEVTYILDKLNLYSYSDNICYSIFKISKEEIINLLLDLKKERIKKRISKEENKRRTETEAIIAAINIGM